MGMEFTIPYPEQLRQNIIQKNWALIETSQLSFKLQIEKAIKRNDIILVTRRIVGFMNSYFHYQRLASYTMLQH